MTSSIRFVAVGAFCLLAVAGFLTWIASLDPSVRKPTIPPSSSSPSAPAPAIGRREQPTSPPPDRPAAFDVILESLEDGGFATAGRYMAPIRDPGSLAELAEAVKGRARRGITELRAKLESPLPDSLKDKKEQEAQRLLWMRSLGLLHMYEGEFREATSWFEKALEIARSENFALKTRTDLMALLGVVALRKGEIENCLECVGPSSCLFPIEAAAVHKNQAGSRAASKWFRAYLDDQPRDLRVIWLLNLAAMTLGEYPEGVPKADRIPLGPFASTIDVGRFENVAVHAGLGVRGPNLAGGSVFDDFSGDGLPDLFTSSLDADRGATLLVNRGDGTFEDRSSWAGLDDQVYALNIRAADYDNDGDLDVLMLRGGWEWPARASLLTNQGDGRFVDTTVAAGLAEPIQSEAAAWGDFDNDGKLDVFLCGETLGPGAKPSETPGDPRNRCRLYRNLGDGKFVNVAVEAGVTDDACAKGAAWGDYDADGKLDLFVSNMGQPCKLYHNEGGGKFRDVGTNLGVTGPDMSFACWFWDYDNDGKLDLYVNDYRAKVPEVLASALGVKLDHASRPRLYRNLGESGFQDVTVEVGLDRAMAPMGCNFGDIDNDGFLDLYLGTGDMAFSGLDRNLMFKNEVGVQFVDVTTSSGTGHLQKGHGVSFADHDGDGDLDVFVELGGAVPGDRGYNALFQNPGHKRHWLKVKLVGKTTNRSGVGALIRADLKAPDGSIRSIYRTVGNNSSFGGNTLVESIGLLDNTTVAELSVTWPTSKSPQVFRDLAGDRAIEITEGSDTVKELRPTPAKTVTSK